MPSVHYFSQKKSWMDCKIFGEWFHQRFVPSVQKLCREKGLEEKALLLVDNAPSHPSSTTLQSEDGKIKTMFLPPNTTAIIQPMDQGVLDPCKRRYKRKLLGHIILENESDEKSVPVILKGITMKDVVYWVAAAWQEASNDSLRKAWRNLLPEPEAEPVAVDNAVDEEGEDDLSNSVASLGPEAQDTVAEWMVADINEPGHQIMDDNEIVAEMVAEDGDDDESDVEEAAADPAITQPTILQLSMLWRLPCCGWRLKTRKLIICCLSRSGATMQLG